jgi:hypothetical protein
MFTEREHIVELCNKLFIYTDQRHWNKLLEDVFTPEVHFDMSSAGGEKAKTVSAAAICDGWKNSLKDLDAIHHQAGNYLITIGEHGADIFCYAIASHFKADAGHGLTRNYSGSYHLHATYTPRGWRLDGFKYHLKFATGNLESK